MAQQEIQAAKLGIIPDWDKYLDTALEVYKYLHSDYIIHSSAKHSGGSSGNSHKKDPNAMDIGSQTMSKGKKNEQKKEKHFCQICARKGKSKSATTHNTADCYDKPDNEGNDLLRKHRLHHYQTPDRRVGRRRRLSRLNSLS